MGYGRELLKGSTDHLLLSLIGQEQMYGYQLIKEIGKRSRGSSLYTVTDALCAGLSNEKSIASAISGRRWLCATR